GQSRPILCDRGCRWQFLQNELYGLYQHRRGTWTFPVCIRPSVISYLTDRGAPAKALTFCYRIDHTRSVWAGLCEKRGKPRFFHWLACLVHTFPQKRETIFKVSRTHPRLPFTMARTKPPGSCVPITRELDIIP